MNTSQRDTLAHGVIAATVLIGAYMLVVDRLQRQLGQTRDQVAALTSQVHECEQLRDRVPEMTQALREAELQAAEIRQKSIAAGSDRTLYTALTDLALRYKVHLDELNPAAASARPTIESNGKVPAVPTEAAGVDVEQAIAFSMVATASFSNVAEFMHAIQTELGYSVIKSARILPVAEEPGMVRATISTEHYAFDVTPRVTAAVEGVTPRE
ncbi:MAG: hypothetical protein NTV94_06135 [Planctomycetota bacterium]|nr:hypothetical protein [Planctomycetota bacterium]